MVGFHTPISLLKLYVSLRGNQPTLNNLNYMQSVINALGFVVDKYTAPSLKSLYDAYISPFFNFSFKYL